MNSLIDTPKHKDLIYDVGMHKGEDTEFYLRKGFRVIAFEANPELVQICKDRFKEFIEQEKLVIVEGAIVDLGTAELKQNKVQFYKNDDVSVWGTVNIDWVERNSRINLGTSSSTIEVDVINLTEVIQKYGVPHYIKIDIEGSDMVCVNVWRKFRERPDYISIESDKTSFAQNKHEISTLVDLGYDYFQAVEQSAIPQSQLPPYPPREGNYIKHRFDEGSSGLFGSELSDKWKTEREILRQCRYIRLGHYLLGNDGIMYQWKFRGAWRLELWGSRLVPLLTKGAANGWYDIHARHSSANTHSI